MHVLQASRLEGQVAVICVSELFLSLLITESASWLPSLRERQHDWKDTSASKNMLAHERSVARGHRKNWDVLRKSAYKSGPDVLPFQQSVAAPKRELQPQEAWTPKVNPEYRGPNPHPRVKDTKLTASTLKPSSRIRHWQRFRASGCKASKERSGSLG